MSLTKIVLFFHNNISFINQTCSIKMAGYWPLFCVFMDLNSISVHKHAKNELARYPATLALNLVNNPYNLYSCKTVENERPELPNGVAVFHQCLVTEDQLSFPLITLRDLCGHGKPPNEEQSFPGENKMHINYIQCNVCKTVQVNPSE